MYSNGMNVPFFSTLGMELTWLYHRKGVKGVESDYIRGYTSLLRARLREHRIPFFAIHTDEGALELATPAFKEMKEVSDYYYRIMNHISCFPLVTRRDDTCSGGGHIHVAIPEKIKEEPVFLLFFLLNLFRDQVNRPYLNWIFNDWGAHSSAESLVHYQKRENNYHQRFLSLLFEDNPKIPVDWKTPQILAVFDCYKGYQIKCSARQISDGYQGNKPETVEFRFFDAKRDFRDIELHINFVNTYLTHIEKITREGTLLTSKLKKPADILQLAKQDRGLKEFEQLVEEIGLDYGEYGHFVELNYKRRKAEDGLR